MSAENHFILKLSAPSMAKLKSFLAEHPQAITMPIGAGLATGVQYLRNRKGANGKTSEQSRADDRLKKLQADSKGNDQDFGKKKELAQAKYDKEVAGIMAKHPLRGALSSALAGAGGAATLTAMGQGLAKLAK
jgi:hypothetical protein